LRRQGEGRPLPDESRAGIEALLALPTAGRIAALPHLREQMERGADKAIEGTNLIAKAKVNALVQKAGNTAAAAIAKMAGSFSRAIAPIWWLNAVLLVLLVGATAALPSLPLRGREERPATPSE